MLREWRGQRKAALHREIARLQQRLAVVTGKQQQEHVAPEERLLEWLKENGGQVGCDRGTRHTVVLGAYNFSRQAVVGCEEEGRRCGWAIVLCRHDRMPQSNPEPGLITRIGCNCVLFGSCLCLYR